jgi:hypothetical protein
MSQNDFSGYISDSRDLFSDEEEDFLPINQFVEEPTDTQSTQLYFFDESGLGDSLVSNETKFDG